MASPTIYKWTDTDAPIIFRNDISSMQALFQACLIDGYSTNPTRKDPPVAGANKWTIPYSDATGFILQQGGTQTRKCGIKIYNPNTSGYLNWTTAVSWSDINTPIGSWSSGTTNDRLASGFSNSNTRQLPWIIIATERAMYCQFGYNSTTTIPQLFDSLITTSTNNGHWFFGDYKPEDVGQTVNQMMCAPNTTSAAYSNMCQNFTTTISISGNGKKIIAGNFTNLDIPGGLVVNTMNLRDSASTAFVIGSNSTSTYRPYFPSPLNGALYLDVLRIISDRSIMGEFPGLLYPLNSEIYPASGIIPEIDGTGTYTGEKMLVFTSNQRGKYLIRDGEWGVD